MNAVVLHEHPRDQSCMLLNKVLINLLFTLLVKQAEILGLKVLVG